MKLFHISFHFEFTDKIEKMLDSHGIVDIVRFPMMEGKDCDGKHFGSQIFPGNTTVVQALVPDEKEDQLFQALKEFRNEKQVHNHLQTAVIPVLKTLKDTC